MSDSGDLSGITTSLYDGSSARLRGGKIWKRPKGNYRVDEVF